MSFTETDMQLSRLLSARDSLSLKARPLKQPQLCHSSCMPCTRQCSLPFLTHDVPADLDGALDMQLLLQRVLPTLVRVLLIRCPPFVLHAPGLVHPWSNLFCQSLHNLILPAPSPDEHTS